MRFYFRNIIGATIMLFSISEIWAIDKINPPYGLQWNISIDRVANMISSIRVSPYDLISPFKEDPADKKMPPRYGSATIIGGLPGPKSLGITFKFWSDSLYEVMLFCKQDKDSKVMQQIFNPEYYNISNTLDTFTIFAIDSSSLNGHQFDSSALYIDFRSPQYSKIDELVKGYKPLPDSFATSLDGFLGIKWGESKLFAKNKMLKRKEITPLPTPELEEEALVFTGGYFANQHVSTFILLFDNDRFFSGEVKISVKEDSKLFATYDEMKNMITEKYGSPIEDLRDFKTPYYDGDGYELQALKLGKAIIKSTWAVKSSGGLLDLISCEVIDEELISIFYLNGDLGQKWLEKYHIKKLKDF